jgi:hypothetical protein
MKQFREMSDKELALEIVRAQQSSALTSRQCSLGIIERVAAVEALKRKTETFEGAFIELGRRLGTNDYTKVIEYCNGLYQPTKSSL